MNYDDLEHAWRSPRNTTDAAALAAAQDRLFAELERRRRSTRMFLAIVLLVLSIITIPAAVALFQPAGSGSGMEFSRDWASLLFLAVPWLGFGLLARRMLRHEREHGPVTLSVRDTVRALLDENAMARGRLKVVALLHGVALLLLPLVVAQLRAAGKAGDEIVWPAFIGWPVVVGAILVAMFWHYRVELRPRQRQMEELLRDHGRED